MLNLSRNSGAQGRQWGVILAGGDGKRLLSLTRTLTGDDRPKQFCAIVGDETLLEQTRRRVQRSIDPERTLLVMTEVHKQFYQDQVAEVPPPCLLIQPQNRGTAAAILYSLMRIRAFDAAARVAFFPSDHYFLNDEAFARQIELAFSLTESNPETVILLGMEPETPETSYGWIQPGSRFDNPFTDSTSHVERFWEKPSGDLACDLMCNGCLWNSFVMVGRVGSFLNLIRRTQPELFEAFKAIDGSLSTPTEREALSSLYAGISSSGFSDDVLSACADDLAVLRCSGLGWSDLGEPVRVLSVLKRKLPRSEDDFKPSRGGSMASSATAI
ncbi:MAG: sugar phosphate nucleotidyltransferase [Terracidiphilus sp.]